MATLALSLQERLEEPIDQQDESSAHRAAVTCITKTHTVGARFRRSRADNDRFVSSALKCRAQHCVPVQFSADLRVFDVRTAS